MERRARELPLDDGELRFRRLLAWGLMGSVAVHLLLALGLDRAVAVDSLRDRAPGPPMPEVVDARLEAVEIGAPEEVEIPPPPPPLELPEETAVTPEPVTASRGLELAEASREPPSAPGGAAGREGDEAAPAGMRPPVPRSVLPEWDPPSSMRGESVTVRVHVDEEGRPTGPVELEPATPDEDFNRRLVEKMREMRFAPARRGGQAVEAWAEITFSF